MGLQMDSIKHREALYLSAMLMSEARIEVLLSSRLIPSSMMFQWTLTSALTMEIVLT